MKTAPQEVSEDQRRQLIADAAHFRAERRGFNGGDPLNDWLEAETEVDARLHRTSGKDVLEELDEIRTQGEHASETAKAQAGKIWHKISDIIERVRSRKSGHAE